MMRRIPIYLRVVVAPHFNAALNVSSENVAAILFYVFIFWPCLRAIDSNWSINAALKPGKGQRMAP